MGGIDTLIINHVYYGEMIVWHGTEEQLAMFEEMSAINYNSYVHIASHALTHLKSVTNGRLGIISSLAGELSSLKQTMYDCLWMLCMPVKSHRVHIIIY